jgi:hypothetical protein
MSRLIYAQEKLPELSLRELQVLAAHLNLREDRDAPRTLPSEVGGEGLRTVASLVREAEEAGGALAAILVEVPELRRSDEILLRGMVNQLFKALDARRADPAPAKVDLQGNLMAKLVNGSGPYAYLRYWAVSGGQDRKKKKLRAVYLGKTYGQFITFLNEHVDQELRAAISRAVIYAYWTEQINDLERVIMKLGWRLNVEMMLILLEQEVQPRWDELERIGSISPQQKAQGLLTVLFELETGDFEGRIRRVSQEWQRRHGAFSPMIGGNEEGDQLTGFEPMLGGDKRPSGENQE